VRANNREGVEGEWVMGNGEEWRMICFLMCAHTYIYTYIYICVCIR
jgi:hypothetical protein